MISLSPKTMTLSPATLRSKMKSHNPFQQENAYNKAFSPKLENPDNLNLNPPNPGPLDPEGLVAAGSTFTSGYLTAVTRALSGFRDAGSVLQPGGLGAGFGGICVLEV